MEETSINIPSISMMGNYSMCRGETKYGQWFFFYTLKEIILNQKWQKVDLSAPICFICKETYSNRPK